jgi:hypothetical protein
MKRLNFIHLHRDLGHAGYNFCIMLKCLAVLTVSLAIAQASAPIRQVATDPKSQSEITARKLEKAGTYEGQNPSATASYGASPQDGGRPRFDGSTQTESDKDVWDKAGIFANYLLVIVGIAGVIAAYFTLAKLEYQTRATQDAAKASLDQVELMKRQMDIGVNKERARIEVKPGTLEVERAMEWLEAGIEVRNIGHSTAYINCIKGWFVISQPGESLPETDGSTMYMPDNFINSQADPVHLSFLWNDLPASLHKFTADMSGGTLVAYLYGHIEYETLGETWHKDFGYLWHMDGDNEQSSSSDIKRLESGWWEKNPEQSNGEFKFPYDFTD